MALKNMGEINSQDIISYFKDKVKHNTDYAQIFDDLRNNFSFDDVSKCLAYIFNNISDVKILNEAIRNINNLKVKTDLPILIDFILCNKLEDNYLNLKVLAIKAISNFKDTSAVSSLLYCLNDKNSNYKIRLAAAEALGKIGDKNAFDSLTNVVCDDKEKSAYVKESAVVALGMLGDTRALDVFDSVINTKQMFLAKFSYLKERMVEAMSKLDISRNKKALKILKNSILDNSPQVRISAIETLMDSDIYENYDLIYDRLKFDDDIEVKKNALIALYNISDRRILEDVIKGNFNEELKQLAIDLIKEYEENE